MKSRSETIRRYGKTLSALVLTLTLSGGVIATNSVFAASDDSNATSSQSTNKWSKGFNNNGKRGGQGQGFQTPQIEQKIADYLNLSLEDLREKQKTQTLAEIAASLNISRDTLKAQLVTWIEAALPTNTSSSTSSSEDKPTIDASTFADKMLDSKGFALQGGGFKGGRAGFGIASDELASLIGITADQLKEEQEAGKTVAEIAEANGVTRDALKAKLVAWLDENKPTAPATNSDSTTADTTKQPTWDSSAIADQILDSVPGKDGGHERGFGGGIGKAYDSAAIAAALGITEDELKTARESGQSIADVAASKGVAVDTVEAALVAALTAQLDTELSNGSITQEQYDKQVEQLASFADKIVNGKFDEQAKGGAPGDRGYGGFGFSTAYDSAAVASVLGVTEDELKTALQSGQSIADVAASKGVAVDTVEQTIVTALKAKLDSELSSGSITQEQYDKQSEQLSAIAEKIVNVTLPAGNGKQHEKRGTKADTATSTADDSTQA
ncbi:hypothetical protein DFQ01_10982 [Paenibacillus cellulosilyticus]|uniref:Uncharacterized protein n=1 Tax=Paenibacillus cellulosilyticus TaxID=375489 RepID=A0A2V2YT14_9BACL|nr:hypothetical protein [Paenibacillus cellulosilyticus]PWW02457.1 hypothetical protein DFQ01_10982 [Paenibacillus cellulosilyticus]QKS47165.1 hypothetical protein HUB94_22230 [Paenibacillus cellulosilyticus]